MESRINIFAGTSSLYLGEKIADAYGIGLGNVCFSKFSDGEFQPSFENSIRGSDIFIIQSTFAPADNLMELLLMIDATKRASAKQIIAVIPYFGFARQDRKDRPRVAIGAKLMANLLCAAGVDRVVTMDLHADQIQGFFDIPVDQLESVTILSNYFNEKNLDKVVVVSPDVGGTARAREFAGRLKKPIAIIDKYRSSFDDVEIMHIVGEVKDKTIIIVDDIIDTATSIIKGSQALLNAGAEEIYICATHPVFANPALERIKKSFQDSLFKEVVVTNTIPVNNEKKFSGIKILSVAEIFAEAIGRIHNNLSVSALFK